MAYKYDLPDGTSFENVAPPAGFNLATASSKLLTELGLPVRPAGAAAMKDWKAQVAPFGKSRVRGSEKFCEMPYAMPEPGLATAGQHAAGVTPLAANGHSPSTIWSGYQLSTGPYYQRVVGHFTQPRTETLDRSMSTWIGLLGAGSGSRLIQAGAGNEVGSGGGSPFWELFCGGGSADGCNTAVIDYSDVAIPGEDVSVNVGFNPSALLSSYQVAIGGALVINVPDQPLQSSNGVSDSMALFITERTGGDNIPAFTTIPFSSSRTYASYKSDSRAIRIAELHGLRDDQRWEILLTAMLEQLEYPHVP